MPEYPPEALTAAQEAISRCLMESGESGTWTGSGEALARAALDAAAPVLAEACAQAILEHMERAGPGLHVELRGEAALRRNMRRVHFSTAARVAASAFSTEEDLKRAAADAIARGDYAVCDIPEPGDGRSSTAAPTDRRGQ